MKSSLLNFLANSLDSQSRSILRPLGTNLLHRNKSNSSGKFKLFFVYLFDFIFLLVKARFNDLKQSGCSEYQLL
jgi:hypothetical protein